MTSEITPVRTNLTAPWDRPNTVPSNVDPNVRLTPQQVNDAMKVNVNDTFVDTFPKIDRVYKDPVIHGQMYCLHSFVPTLGSKPDEKGVYGFIKCRGTYATLEDSKVACRNIIENVDSNHVIYTSRTGEPFPVCSENSPFTRADEKDIVDIRKHAVKTISEDLKRKRMEERKEIEDMKEREKKLLEESKAAQEDNLVRDPLDVYIEKHVKKANLAWTYMEMKRKLDEIVPKIKGAYREIRELDSVDPSLSKKYYERYLEARKRANVPDNDPNQDQNWMKYLCEDAKFDFDPHSD